ncbi:Hypothetical predicted protein [Cloeon dipterum]|uniref:C-type lectin domain-containing protein n=1 Tax=Cloeon dipterum TaxID=197152 RepID=A0A8S1DXF5_9INSE|nr:Hypothetical predicted protein [Cloeon dipterum]
MMNVKWLSLINLTLLSVMASRRGNLLRLTKKLEGLISNLQFPDARTTKTPAPGLVNFVKPVSILNPADPNKKYCTEAVCPETDCKLADLVKVGKLRKTIPIPKIYSLRNSTVKTYISVFRYDFHTAMRDCCLYNSSLMAFTSPQLLEAFQNTLKLEKRLKAIFWLSGLYSKECNAYVWCPEKEIIGENGPSKWRSGFPNQNSGDCLGVQTGQQKEEENGLFNFECSLATNYMCYVNNYNN